MNMYKRIVPLMFLLLFFCIPGEIHATDEDLDALEEEELDEKLLDKLTIEEVDVFWEQIGTEYGEFIPDIKDKNIAELIKENGTISFKSTVKGILTYLFYELIVNGKLLG